MWKEPTSTSSKEELRLFGVIPWLIWKYRNASKQLMICFNETTDQGSLNYVILNTNTIQSQKIKTKTMNKITGSGFFD